MTTASLSLQFARDHRDLAGAALIALLALTGCPNPNVYATARTTPKRQVSHTISAEVVGAETDSVSGAVPILPSYHFRYGVSDRTEFGAHAIHLTQIGLDYKWNFLRSRTIDLAIDPAIHGSRFEYETDGDADSAFLFYFHGPLLIDINASEALSFVLSPGVLYALASDTSIGVSDDGLGGVADVSEDIGQGVGVDLAGSGLLARFGLGMNFRVSPTFAVQPEVTFLKELDDDFSSYVFTAGIGFSFGALPSFGPDPY